MPNESAPIPYNDRWLIIVTVPIINLLNYYLTYSGIRLDWFFLITLSLDTITGYLSWYALRAVIVWLDKKYWWEKGIVNRVLVQIPLASAAFLAVIVATTELVNFIAADKPVPRSFYTFDLIIFLIWALFLNLLYVCLYLFSRLHVNPDNKNPSPLIWVKIGKQQKPLDLQKAICFYVEHECVYALDLQGKQIVAGYTLDRLEKLSDPARFFRANRQFLITRDIVQSVNREENGKLSLTFSRHELPGFIMVSRLRASALKDWLGT